MDWTLSWGRSPDRHCPTAIVGGRYRGSLPRQCKTRRSHRRPTTGVPGVIPRRIGRLPGSRRSRELRSVSGIPIGMPFRRLEPRKRTMSTTETPRPSHTGRTVALIVVGVIVLAVIAWLAVGVVRAATRPVGASDTFEIDEPFDSVVLDGDLADVSVEYGDVSRSELTLRQGDARQRLELDHEVRGDTLHVSLTHVREFGMPELWWPWFGARSPELVLVLPAQLESRAGHARPEHRHGRRRRRRHLRGRLGQQPRRRHLAARRGGLARRAHRCR